MPCRDGEPRFSVSVSNGRLTTTYRPLQMDYRKAGRVARLPSYGAAFAGLCCRTSVERQWEPAVNGGNVWPVRGIHLFFPVRHAV